MEPFRILVDRKVVELQPQKLEREEKHALWEILSDTVRINQSRQLVLNAIRIYCAHIWEALSTGDPDHAIFYETL